MHGYWCSHPPYSPDLDPCDFYLFFYIKKFLAGSKFASEQELKTAVEGYLGVMSEMSFLQVFEKWEERCNKCISVAGGYVEKS